LEDNLDNNAGTLSGVGGCKMISSGALLGLNNRFALAFDFEAKRRSVDDCGSTNMTNKSITNNQVRCIEHVRKFTQ
jgi:hypothetical protein